MRLLNVLPLALGVSSLLVPPQGIQVSELSGLQMSDRLPLKCIGGCPAIQGMNGNQGVWTKKSTNRLGVEVTVNEEKVLFNGEQIWPRPALPPALSIKQSQGQQLVPVSSSLDYKTDILLNKGVNGVGAIKMHPISVEIMAVGDQIVKAQSVEVRVIEYGSGIALAGSIIRPYKSSPLIDSCTNIWCRVRGTLTLKYNEWRQAIAGKLRGWRKCGQKAGHKIGGARIMGGPKKFGPGSTLHPHGHHGNHGHHGHHHRGWLRFMKRVFKVVVIPTVLGLGIGMTVGSLLKIVITRIQQRRAAARGEYVEVKQSEAEEGRGSIEGPPKYEEVYGEEQVEKEDEKN